MTFKGYWRKFDNWFVFHIPEFDSDDYPDHYFVVINDKRLGYTFIEGFKLVDKEDVPEDIRKSVLEYIDDPFFEIDVKRYKERMG